MKTRSILALAVVLGLAAQVAYATPRAAQQKKVVRGMEINSMIHKAMAQRYPSSRGAVQRLISRVARERDPSLHRMGVMSLLRRKMPLQRDQKKAILKMVRSPTRGLLPKRPPIPKKGTIEVRHYAMHGFMKDDLKQMEQSGFKIKKTPGGAVATRGRYHVVVSETHNNIMRDLNDSKVNMIVYNGHSQIGGTVEQALLQESMKQPRGRKLIALFQCVGTQTLPLLKARAPGADIITSKVPLYVAETPHLMRELYNGVEKGDGYHSLRRRIEKVAWGKNRLVFPNQTASLGHVDYDMNGVLDKHQKPGSIQVLNRKERRAAKSLLSGVHYLRTMNPYYAGDTPGAVFKPNQTNVPLRSMGINKGQGQKTVTKFVEHKAGGKKWFEIALNNSYKTAPRHFVGAAAVFETQMKLQEKFLGKKDLRAKVRALAFTGEYLDLIPRNKGKAQDALNRLTKMNGLPQLSMYQVRNAIAGDHVIGEKQVDKLEALVNRANGLNQPR